MLNHIGLPQALDGVALAAALYFMRSSLTRSALRGYRFRLLVELAEVSLAAVFFLVGGAKLAGRHELSHSRPGAVQPALANEQLRSGLSRTMEARWAFPRRTRVTNRRQSTPRRLDQRVARDLVRRSPRVSGRE